MFAHVADASPTFFGGVPRIWEKLKAALEAGIAAEPDEARRTATLDAIELGLRKVRAEQAGEAGPATSCRRRTRGPRSSCSRRSEPSSDSSGASGT